VFNAVIAIQIQIAEGPTPRSAPGVKMVPVTSGESVRPPEVATVDTVGVEVQPWADVVASARVWVDHKGVARARCYETARSTGRWPRA